MSSQVTVVVSLISGAVQTGLTKIRAQFQNLRNDLSHSLGSFLALGALEQGLHRLIERGTELSNVSRRFGAPASELQRVTNAGRENGAQIEDVARSWNKLTVNQQKAIHGNEEMRKAFEKLGIPMTDVARMTVDQLFYRVADATASAEDRGKAYAAVVQLMGRNAGLLYTTLEKGSGVIKAQGDEIGVMSDKTIERLHKLHVTIQRLQNTIFIFGGGIVGFLANVVESIGALVGEVTNEAELMIRVLGAAAKIAKDFGSGLLKGEININTKPLVDAVEDVKKNAGGLAKVLSGIWKQDEHHVGGEGKKPLEAEIDPTSSETAAAEKLVTLREQLAELQRKASNDELTIQEKINALVVQRAALLKEASGTKDEEKKLQLQIDAEKVGQEITAAIKERTRYIQQADREREREDEEAKRSVGQRIPANSLRRIGGQETGGFAVQGLDDKILKESKSHTEILKKIENNTSKGSGELIMP